MPEYIGLDERKHWYITSLDGPWQVASGGPGSGYKGSTWYIVNTNTGRTKFIGPASGKGKNYFEAAVEVAEKRNAQYKKDFAPVISEEKRANWYFTFLQRQPLLKNKFVVFYGTYNEARDQMVENFGSLWAFQYSEADFIKDDQEAKFGLKRLV